MGHTRLTREGFWFILVLAFVVLSGSMRQINMMLVMAGMMVGILYFNWRGARTMLRDFQLRRRLPQSVEAGQPCIVELEATSPRNCFAVVIEDGIQRAGQRVGRGAAAGAVSLPRIRPGIAARGQYRVVFETRGRCTLGPAWATTRFPFGLVARRVPLRETDEVLVLPRLGRMTGRWTRRAQVAAETSRRPLRRQTMADGDFYGLRDWRPGDSRRLIHWRTSARRGGLMVRQFEQAPDNSLVLLLELWRPDGDAATAEQSQRVELAIRFAATAVVEACRRGGGSLTVIVAGREFARFAGAGSKALARDILRHLAVARPSAADQAAKLMDSIQGNGRAGRTALVTTRPAEAAGATSAGQRNVLRLEAGSEAFLQFFDAT